MSDNSDVSESPIIAKGKRKAAVLTDSGSESESSTSDLDAPALRRNRKRKNRICDSESNSDSSIEKPRKMKRVLVRFRVSKPYKLGIKCSKTFVVTGNFYYFLCRIKLWQFYIFVYNIVIHCAFNNRRLLLFISSHVIVTSKITIEDYCSITLLKSLSLQSF